MRSMGPTRRRRTRVGWVPFLLLALTVGGFAGGIAASSVVIASGSEHGRGDAVSASTITWWRMESLAVASIPSGPPATASTNVSAPTSLPNANTSYVLGAATVGDGALAVVFVQRAPPGSTEFELNVTFVNATGVTTQATVYLETPSTVPAGPVTFTFYLDLGAGVPVFGHASELAQGCMSLRVCP